MTACAQCRQRKVRCQGAPPRCAACTRLGFQCSFNLAAVPTTGETQITIPRKRGARACDSCRAHRSKCSAESPTCERCQRLNIPCHYSLSIRQYRAADRKRESTGSHDGQSSQTSQLEPDGNIRGVLVFDDEGVSPATSASGSFNSVLRCEHAVVKSHIQAYFEHIYPVQMFSFLHRADFLSRWSMGQLPANLLLAVCGIGSRFLPEYRSMANEAKSWIEQAEAMIFRQVGKPTIADLQTLMILALYRGQNFQNNKSFLYLGLAARMVYILKLHRDDLTLPFIEQESRRRLVWCVYVTDRLNAGGIPEYIVLRSSSLRIQLPCAEHFYEADVAIQTPHLNVEVEVTPQLSLSALLIRLFEIRTHILQYAKKLLDTMTSPELGMGQFQLFENQLRSVYDAVPSELVFNVRAFQLRAFSPERNTFVVFHLYYHHCHCELYRLLNPGYREALPQHVIQATSSELVAYAQAKCLEHAVAIGEIIVSTSELGGADPYISDLTLFVMLYQASCAILYACHRESPAYTMSATTARLYFVAFIKVLEGMLPIFPRLSIFVMDIRNMLRSIDDPNAPLPLQKSSTEVDFRARQISSEENSDEENRQDRQGNEGFATGQGAQVSPTVAIRNTDLQNLDAGQALSPQPQSEVAGQWAFDPRQDEPFSTFLDEGLIWDWADALGTNFAS